MKKKTKILIYVITFIVVFLISALIRIMLLGSAPERMIKVEWDESVGEIYINLDTLQKGTLQLLLIIRCRIRVRTHQSI